MFAQQRREFGYLYAYLFDVCHIADSDHPSVMRSYNSLGYHSRYASTLIANIFLATTRERIFGDRRSLRGTPRAAFREREREKERKRAREAESFYSSTLTQVYPARRWTSYRF